MEKDTALFWEYIEGNSAEFSKSIPANAGKIIHLLIQQWMEDESAETGLTADDEVAIMPWNQYSNVTLALRYHIKGYYELYFQYYDDDEEDTLETAHRLSEEEINSLPSGIPWLLKETITKRKPQRIDPNRLY